MKRWCFVTLLLVACDSFPLSPVASVPWVHGFRAAAAGDVSSLAAAQRISALRGASLEDGSGIELRADIAGDAKVETVLVSFSAGVIVLDPAGRMIASAPGFDVSGSADDLISVAVGDSQLGQPAILVAVQLGGHRESAIWLAVYQLQRGKLQRVFFEPIEEHDGMETSTGSLTFVWSSIVYRAPGAQSSTIWTFDPRRQLYVEQRRIEPGAPPPNT